MPLSNLPFGVWKRLPQGEGGPSERPGRRKYGEGPSTVRFGRPGEGGLHFLPGMSETGTDASYLAKGRTCPGVADTGPWKVPFPDVSTSSSL